MVKLVSAVLAIVLAAEILGPAVYSRYALESGYRIVGDRMPAEEHSHGRVPRDGTVRERRAVSSTSTDTDYVLRGEGA